MMNFSVRWYLRLFLMVNMYWISNQSTWAQRQVFDHYGPKEGLITSQVLSISKDSHGFIWLGTEDGLARYDAHDFRYFRHDYKDDSTLSSNYISDITCDKHDRIWVNTGRSLDIFNISTNKVKRYEDEIFKANSPKITHVYYDHEGDTIWITTVAGIFFSEGNKIALKEKKFPKVSGTIHDMVKWGSFRYVLAGDKAVFIHDVRTGSTEIYHHAYHQKNIDDGFLCTFVENDSIVWAGSWVHGLLRINAKTGQSRSFTYKNPLQEQNGVLDIQKLRPDGHEIFLATTDGILTFDTKTESFQSKISENIFDVNGIAGAGFTFLADGTSLWVGTYKGLYKYDLLKNFIKDIPLHIKKPTGVPEPQDVCFERNNHGVDSIIWISFAYGSTHRYDLTSGSEMPMPKAIAPYIEHKKSWPYSMLIDRDNVLWISTEDFPLLICDIEKNKMLQIIPDHVLKDQVLQFCESEDGKVWLGTDVTWYEATRKENSVEIHENDYLAAALLQENNNLSAIPYIFTIDSEKNIWFLATDKTKNLRIPVLYQAKSRKIYPFYFEKYPELRRLGWVDGLTFVAENEILVSGISGLGKIKKVNHDFLFLPFETNQNINQQHTKHVVADKQGNIIMSADFGISVLKKDNDLWSAFTYYTASIGNAIQPSVFTSPNTAKIYLGQKLSLDYFEPENVLFPAPDTILLSNINIRGYQPAKKIENGDFIRLFHNQNQIQISVTNLFYTNPEYSKYYFRWSDEETWTENPDNHFNFSNLSPGKYYLQIKSSNAFGVMGTDIFRLNFIISPPFYKTWWFYLLLSLSAIATMYAFFWFRDQQRKKMEKLRHHIARDLHDDLGSSLSYIRILSESEAGKTKDNQSYTHISEKTAEIMNSMSEIIWSINPIYDSFNNVVTRLQDFAIETLEPLGIELKFKIDNLPDKYKLSPEKRRQYYLIFKEAINNTAKYSKAKKVMLTIRQEKDNIITQLEDNGIGFDSLLIHKGNGLKNMKVRADLLGASLVIRTHDKGTQVTLSMKG